MNFSQALIELNLGDGIRLPSWSEDVVIFCQFPDKHSKMTAPHLCVESRFGKIPWMPKMTAPYLYIESRFGKIPWMPTQIELFSNEWDSVGSGDWIETHVKSIL